MGRQHSRLFTNTARWVEATAFTQRGGHRKRPRHPYPKPLPAQTTVACAWPTAQRREGDKETLAGGEAASASRAWTTYLPAWGRESPAKGRLPLGDSTPKGGKGEKAKKKQKGKKGERKGEGRGGNPWADARRMPPRGSRAPARVPAGCRRGPVRPETAAEPLQDPTNYSTIGGLP